jgi:DNA mismatch endonuclease (patch repair protein)
MAVKRAFIDAESPPSAERSALMARVSSRDTRPEMAVRRAAHALGLRYRLHRRDLPGTPDLVFARFRTVVFIHGCFWHRHAGCRRATTPKTRRDFWQTKFDANVERDRRTVAALESAGWAVVVIWECEAIDEQPLKLRLQSLLRGSLGGGDECA